MDSELHPLELVGIVALYGGALGVLRGVVRYLRLRLPIWLSIRSIRNLVSNHAPVVRIDWIGAIGIDPRHLALWIFVPTDADSQRLDADAALEVQLRACLARSCYPAKALPDVGFAFASQEAVERDYNGQWWLAYR